MEMYNDKIKNLNSNQEFVWEFTREQELEMIKNTEVELARDEGMDRGATQKSIEVAKNMLVKNKYTDDEIISISGLTKEQLDELKHE